MSILYYVESCEILIFVGQKWVNIGSFILFNLIVNTKFKHIDWEHHLCMNIQKLTVDWPCYVFSISG